MLKIRLNCVVVVLIVVSGCLGLPQGRRDSPQEKKGVEQDASQLNPAAIDEGMSQEHAKLIENLQRLKRTLDTVKERVSKGSYGETANVDMKNPEGAILTVLKSLQEQGQLFSMINDMLKAGAEVQNQTAKIQEFNKLAEQAHAESVIAENTNQLQTNQEPVPTKPTAAATPSVGPTDLTGTLPVASASRVPSTSRRGGAKQNDQQPDPAKQHGYEDYQYQYSDDSSHATGDDQYDYHYDAQGYDVPRNSARESTTTTTSKPSSRRVRGRSRSEYY